MKSKGLDRVRNENVFPQIIFDKRLETNSQNQAKFVFPWNVLQLVVYDFLPKIVNIWLLGGRLSTRHQTQAFQGFF